MKKLLFSIAAATLATATIQAQTRLSLYEEFSGENCGPCAAYNPGLTTLLSANTAKVQQIKYQSPIPSAGPIYNAYKTVTNARLAYYAVNSAPTGIQNGNEVNGHIANYTQANIDAGYAASTPFAITVTESWNAAADSVTANITVSTPGTAFKDTTNTMKLRVALIEHLSYCSAPGTNGETEFHNVVREMYPTAGGIAIDSMWNVGASKSFTVSGKVPGFVNKSNSDAVIVVWIQKDNNKYIYQSAKSTHTLLPLDAGLTGICPTSVIGCVSGGTTSASVVTPVTLSNLGATTLTAATITYQLDNGSTSTYAWSGTLAAGASTTVNLPAISVTSGNHTVHASITQANGVADVNTVNNSNSALVTVRDATPATLPVSADFESGLPANWTLYEASGSGKNWMLKSGSGHNSSIASLEYNFYDLPTGNVGYAIMPNATLPSGSRALDFWVAYAQYDASYEDMLEVVYSTNCGANWSTVWSAKGAALATTAATTNSYTPSPDDWHLKSIDMSSVPSGAAVAFRATSAYGNNLYIDDVNLRSGATLGIHNTQIADGISLYPNPAHNAATLRFGLHQGSRVSINVLDATGRTAAVVADREMQAGAQEVSISTSGLAAGIYNVVIRTDAGVMTQRLSVIK